LEPRSPLDSGGGQQQLDVGVRMRQLAEAGYTGISNLSQVLNSSDARQFCTVFFFFFFLYKRLINSCRGLASKQVLQIQSQYRLKTLLYIHCYRIFLELRIRLSK
jgi:hypothetical protein